GRPKIERARPARKLPSPEARAIARPRRRRSSVVRTHTSLSHHCTCRTAAPTSAVQSAQDQGSIHATRKKHVTTTCSAQTQSAAPFGPPATPAEELTCPGILAGSSGPRAVDCSSEVPFHLVDDEMSRPVHGPSDLTPEWLRVPPPRPWRDARILKFVRPPFWEAAFICHGDRGCAGASEVAGAAGYSGTWICSVCASSSADGHDGGPFPEGPPSLPPGWRGAYDARSVPVQHFQMPCAGSSTNG